MRTRRLMFCLLACTLAMSATGASNRLARSLDRYLDYYETAAVDLPNLSRRAAEQGSIEWVLDGQILELELTVNDVTAGGYQGIDIIDGVEVAAKPQVANYRGRVRGIKDSDVRLTLGEDALSGYILLNGEFHHLNSAWRFDAEAPSDFVVSYRDADVRTVSGPPMDFGAAVERLRSKAQQFAQVGAGDAKIMELVVVGDAQFVADIGSRQKARFVVLAAINALDGILSNELNMNVDMVRLQLFVGSDPFVTHDYGHGPKRLGNFVTSNNPTCDPAVPTGLWEDFRAQSNITMAGIHRDAALLFTGRNLMLCPAGSTGAAELFGTAGDHSTICGKPDRAYVVMEEYPVNTAGLMAHELGHSLGVPGNQHDNQTVCENNPPGTLLCGTVQAGATEYSTLSLNLINGNLATDGDCVVPPTIEAPVASGEIYYFNSPTQTFVNRSENIRIKNAGGTILNISNPTSVVSGGCFSQGSNLPSTMLPGESVLLRVDMFCSSPLTTTGTVNIQSNDPSGPYTFTLRGQAINAPLANVSLDATYAPNPFANRVTHESTVFYPEVELSFYNDPNQGHFAHRPGAPCHQGGTNPTYLTMKVDASRTITACTFQASWDQNPVTCSGPVIAAMNAKTDFIINTDDFLSNDDCRLNQPLEQHVRYDEPHHMQTTLIIDGAEYRRRVNFRQNSEVHYRAVGFDTYANEANAGANFGTDPILRVRNGVGQRRYSFVRVNSAAVSKTIRSGSLILNETGSDITSLRLWLQQSNSPLDRWERDLTWSNWQTQTGGDVSVAAFVSAAQRKAFHIDLGHIVNTPGLYDFRLETLGPGTNGQFGSGESAADKPYLIITTY